MMKMEDLVKFSKANGFVYPGSEIYGGLANTWDYGPLGVELKNNIKKVWWQKYIQENRSAHGLDAAILMNPKVWEASGHVGGFNDPLMDCKECKTRHRADKLIENFTNGDVTGDGMSNQELATYIKEHKIPCPKCKAVDSFTDIRNFNLMFETYRGVTEDSQSKIYLRPETAQGQFVNFLNVQRSQRAKVPFGIGQVGKAFRNEITPGNFTFRTVEFEQMEFQWFCKEENSAKFYDDYKTIAMDYFKALGLKEENLRFHDHEKLAHYASAAADIEYKFAFGWGEINGTHNRGNFDLTQHQEHSKKSMEYLDPETNTKFIPHVVESTIGPDRTLLAVLNEAFEVETLEDGETRDVLRLVPAIAPYKIAVLPLMKKFHNEKANEVFKTLSKEFRITFDEAGKIGKRYRRQDAIGTPFAVTIDDETIENGTVTIRNRDTMKQERMSLEEVIKFVSDKIKI